MRIRTILAAAAAPAALAAFLLGTTGTAFASTGPASNGQVSQMTGNGSKSSAAQTYTDSVFGQVKVNETQHPNFDTVSAKFTGGQTAASLGMWPGETGTVGWNSDFGNAALSTHSQTGTLTYTINADGTGYTGQATYPAS
jgi:hypothetical protein